MERQIASLLALAREDLDAARLLHERHPRQAAFQLELAAEKIIKAVLMKERIAFSARHHQLGRLVDLLPPDHVWRAELAALDRHSPATVMHRDPTPGGAVPQGFDLKALAAGIAEIEALLPEIAAWCGEQQPAQVGASE